jgi:class 3 adenylate cyclase
MQLWGELEAPWQVARARVLLARAYAAIGDRDGARLELQAARAAFDELGADLDRRQAETELAALGTDGGTPTLAPGRRIVTRTFVFTDIVDSTRFAELLGDEAWERLVRWHDELIRSLVAEHAGEVIKSTGDGFFLAFERSGPAIDCAIAVQRRLAEQRRTQGFAPALRVGLHHGPARRTGSDYIGTNVNEAARISAIAQGGEILASIPTLEEAGRLAMAGERRTVRLKGIAGPVEVATIAW